MRGRVTWTIRFSKIRDSLERLAELNSPAMITEDFVKYCIDRIDIRAEGDVMKLTISLVTGKIAEKQLELLRPGNRRLPLLTGRRFNFNREDGKGRIKSKVSYHVQIKLV